MPSGYSHTYVCTASRVTSCFPFLNASILLYTLYWESLFNDFDWVRRFAPSLLAFALIVLRTIVTELEKRYVSKNCVMHVNVGALLAPSHAIPHQCIDLYKKVGLKTIRLNLAPSMTVHYSCISHFEDGSLSRFPFMSCSDTYSTFGRCS